MHAPKVSVMMLSFNQARYLSQAVASVVQQRFDYSIELVICDDASQDGTQDILRQLAADNPNLIRIFLHERNLGPHGNFRFAYDQCRGQYIALLDADDYWTDPNKLNRQIGFLEQNPDFAISSHNVLVVHEDQSEAPHEWRGREVPEIATIQDLLRLGSGGATGSLVFRKGCFGEFPSWYAEQQGGDWTLQVLCASSGKMRYFRECMGVYRRGIQGLTSYEPNSQREIDIYRAGGTHLCRALNRHFDYCYDREIQEILHNYFYHNLFTIYSKRGDTMLAAGYAWRMIIYMVQRRAADAKRFIPYAQSIPLGIEDNQIESTVALIDSTARRLTLPSSEIDLIYRRFFTAAIKNAVFVGSPSLGLAQRLLASTSHTNVTTLYEASWQQDPAGALIGAAIHEMSDYKGRYLHCENFEAALAAVNEIDLLVVHVEELSQAKQELHRWRERMSASGYIVFITEDKLAPGLTHVLNSLSQIEPHAVCQEGNTIWLTSHGSDSLTYIVPCYNCADTVVASIESIAQQRHEIPFEVVCTDDGSTDNTLETLEDLRARFPWLRVFRNDKNLGGGATRNNCVARARGNLLFCLDSDNILLPDSVKPLYCYMKERGTEAASFEEIRYFHGSTGEYSHSWHFIAPDNVCDINHVISEIRTPAASGNYLYTRRSFQRAGGYPDRHGALDAWGFGFRQHATGTAIAVLPKSAYMHRIANNSYWNRENRAGTNDRNAAAIAKEHLECFEPQTRILLADGVFDNNILSSIEAKKLIPAPGQTPIIMGKREKQKLKLHIGCGPRILKGWVNIDLSFEPYENYLQYYGDEFYPPSVRGTREDFMIFDVTKAPLPFEDNSVDLIFNEDFIEHLDQKQAVLFLAESFRLLKPGGLHRISTPNLAEGLRRCCRFENGYLGVDKGEWDKWHHYNVMTPAYLRDIAELIGFQITFRTRDVSISRDLPKEYRPSSGPDCLNIFADLIKPSHLEHKAGYETRRSAAFSVELAQ